MKTLYGIQGGKGSFNEEALFSYVSKVEDLEYKVHYLYTSSNVLDSLNMGQIDLGLFALHNSRGGIVEESVSAMADHVFEIVDVIEIPICHFLMKRKDVDWENIDRIVTHPQAIKQCRNTLERKYKGYEISSGEAELIDHALMAKALSEGKVNTRLAVIGSRILATIYDLDIVDEHLQDEKNNVTSFLLVKRK